MFFEMQIIAFISAGVVAFFALREIRARRQAEERLQKEQKRLSGSAP